MKQFYDCLLGALCMLLVVGQGVSQTVISSQGAQDQNDRISLSWTLGEMAVSANTASGFYLTEGYHQPLLSVQQVTERDLSGQLTEVSATIFPNPTTASLQLVLEDPPKEKIQLLLKDLHGKVILVDQVQIDQQLHKMELQRLPGGTYFLEMFQEKEAARTVFKIVKMN